MPPVPRLQLSSEFRAAVFADPRGIVRLAHAIGLTSYTVLSDSSVRRGSAARRSNRIACVGSRAKSTSPARCSVADITSPWLTLDEAAGYAKVSTATITRARKSGALRGYASRTPFKSPQGDTLIHIKASKGRRRRLQEGEAERILEATTLEAVQQEFAERRADIKDAARLGRLARSERTANAEAAYIADYFAAMLETGCRPGELRTLQWSEVRDGHIVILDTKAKDRDERSIPIEPTLEKILARRHIGPDGNKLGNTAYVFGNETGEAFSKERICGMWRRVCARAKVSDLHLHDLRADFASQLSEANVPVSRCGMPWATPVSR